MGGPHRRRLRGDPRRALGRVAAGALLLFAPAALAQLVAPKEKPSAPVTMPSEVPAQPVEVVLRLDIDIDGNVVGAKVVERAPADAPEAYDARALEYARGLSFEPATKDGQAIPARIPFHVRFAMPAPVASASSAPPAASSPPTSASAAPSALPTAPSSSASTASSAEPPKSEVAAATGDEKEAERHIATETDITVTGRTEPRSHGPSDFHIHVGNLALVPRKNATELLTLAPGILLTNEGGEGHAEQVFLRGFDAREGQDLEFTVGGVPINDAGNLHGNGYADTHFIIPEVVSSLRVLEGPFAPQQGNFAVAGSADYELGLEQRGLTTKYTVGSFGTQRWLAMYGPAAASAHTFGAAELYETKGYGQNRDARRATAIGQYEGDIGGRGSYRVTATAYATSFHSAGVLREDDYDYGRVKFFDTYDPLQGGDASRYSLAVDYETGEGDVTYRQQIFLIDRGMRLRENFTGFLLDVQQPLQNPHGQRGDLLDLDFSAVTFGARGSARFRGKAFDLPQELELGWFARGDRTTATQYRLESSMGHPYHLDTDLTSRLADLGMWADGNVKLHKLVTLRGGLRADLFAFDVLNACAVQSVRPSPTSSPPGDASCLSQESFGAHREPIARASTASAAMMPRATLILGALHGFTVSASWGNGVRSIDPSYVTQDTETPFAKIRAYEAGLSYVRANEHLTLTARSVVFQTKVDRDLVFSETAGRNTLGNGTTRTGWLGAVRATGDFFDQAANLTVVRSRFDDTGLLVPYVPDLVLRSDTALFHDLPLRIDGTLVSGALGAGVTWVGHRALPYGQRSDAIFTVDGSASLRWRPFTVDFTVTNLLGRRYRLGEYDYASDFHTEPQATLVPMRHFTAGMPRAFFVTFGATIGGT